MGIIWNDFALPIGGLLTAVFVGWVWRVDRAIEEVEIQGAPFPGRALWGFLIRWVCRSRSPPSSSRRSYRWCSA